MANVVGIAAEQLQQIVMRIERLEEEKKGIADDIKEVYAEAKSNGFDVKILRQVIRLRKMDKAALQEQDALLELYRDALDMTPDEAAETTAPRAATSPSPGAAAATYAAASASATLEARISEPPAPRRRGGQPRKKKQKGPTKRAVALAERVRVAGALHVEHTRAGRERYYWPDGTEYEPGPVFRECLRRDMIVPVGDGMFGTTQTYVAPAQRVTP